MPLGALAGGLIATLVSTGVGLYEANQSASIQRAALGIAQGQFNNQQYYNSQLMQLMANPSSFANNPAYSFATAQGEDAVARETAAGGFNNSGNQAAALQAYGQGAAYSGLYGQESLLAGISGLGFNPAAATGVASNAQGQTFNELGSVLASLGYSAQTNNYGSAGGNTFGQTPGAGAYSSSQQGYYGSGGAAYGAGTALTDLAAG